MFLGTARKSPKTKHRFTLNEAPFRTIAGRWREQTGNQPPAFTMLTPVPGPDVEPHPQSPDRRATPARLEGVGLLSPNLTASCCSRSLRVRCSVETVRRRCGLGTVVT